MARSLKIFVVVVALVVAAPAGSAQAAAPARTVSEAEGFVIPAGAACTFDVAIEPADGPITTVVTGFSDGRVVATIRQGFIRMTNVETGDSLVHHSQYRGMTTYDALADQYRATTDGTAWYWFFPGDAGPFGVVGDPGALLSLTGHADYTWDPDTFATTSFKFDGQINADLCAMLSPA